MLRQHRHLVSTFAFSTLLTIAGTACAATTIKLNSPPTAAEIAIARRAIPDVVRKAEAEHNPLSFLIGHADLNGDGRPDLIVQYIDQGSCVGFPQAGCKAYALLAVPGGGYSTHAIPLPLFEETVVVLDAMHHGMHDLRFDHSTHVFHWTGTAYQ